VSDKAAGDTNGQGTKNVWYVIDPTGKQVGNPAAAAAATVAPAVSAGVMLNAGQNAALGSFLVDSKGMTLYVFSNDTANTSNCSGSCATNWPPLLTNGAPVAKQGKRGLACTFTRFDGGIQVTYNGMPVYNFANDKAAGDTNGQGVKNLWHVIDLTGKPLSAPRLLRPLQPLLQIHIIQLLFRAEAPGKYRSGLTNGIDHHNAPAGLPGRGHFIFFFSYLWKNRNLSMSSKAAHAQIADSY